MDSIDVSQSREGERLSGEGQITVGNVSGEGIAIGNGAQVIIQKARSYAAEAREQEAFEREKLAEGVAHLAEKLYQRATTAPSTYGSPYKHLLPYDLSDAAQFFGRQQEVDGLVEDLTCEDSRCRLVVLHGEAGIGKTSLIWAGLAPHLVALQHLPLLVRVSRGSLVTEIKGSLVPYLQKTPGLKDLPLKEFLSQAADSLPPGKHICVALDQFESFFDLPSEEKQQFIDELEECIFDEDIRHRWLISIRSSRLGFLSAFQPGIPQPLATTRFLPPLSKEEARLAIQSPARSAGYVVEPALLEALLSDLGGETVDPSSLQMVCHTLVDGLPKGEKELTLAEYKRVGQAQRILAGYLDIVLERHLQPEDRQPAWQVLAGLDELRNSRPTLPRLENIMQTYDVPPEETRKVLDLLVNNRLVQSSGDMFYLAHPGFRLRVRDWLMQQAALEQARQEVRRQVRWMRNSALRGLLGGGLGFMLAYGLAYFNQTPRLWLTYFSLQRALPGAIAGLLLVLFVDVALASYHGEHRWLRWLAGALAGAATVSLAVAYHGLLNLAPIVFPAMLPGLLIQGVLWGLAVGLGTVWARLTRRPSWQILPPVALAGSLALWLGEEIGNAFDIPQPGWIILLAGAVLPVFIAASSRLGRRIDIDE